jgi:hypothetical protein
MKESSNDRKEPEMKRSDAAMNTARKIVLPAIALLVASCATMQLPAPKSSADYLLALPRLVIDNRDSMTPFNYTMEIVMEDVKTQKERRLRVDYTSRDYVYYQNIPPGKYLIKRLVSPSHQDSDNYRKYVEIEAGAMTIFPYKLVIQIEDKYWSYALYDIEKEDMEKIRQVLSREEGYKLWNK